MFHLRGRKKAVEELKKEKEAYQAIFHNTMADLISLHGKRAEATELISEIEHYVKSLSNVPKEFEKMIGEAKVNKIMFESELEMIDIVGNQAEKEFASKTEDWFFKRSPETGAAIAAVLGTASARTATAWISGAEFKHEAVPWEDQGTLVAGGGGLAAGGTFLALTGPPGWTVGSLLLISGGLFVRVQNVKVAKDARQKTHRIKMATEQLLKISAEVSEIKTSTEEICDRVNLQFQQVNGCSVGDYEKLDGRQSDDWRMLLDDVRLLSKKLSEKANC